MWFTSSDLGSPLRRQWGALTAATSWHGCDEVANTHLCPERGSAFADIETAVQPRVRCPSWASELSRFEARAGVFRCTPGACFVLRGGG